MRASMATEAVARELWPKERMVAMCLTLGGLKESWVVARRRARWREGLLGLESRAALLWEALSLIRPMMSLTFVTCPMPPFLASSVGEIINIPKVSDLSGHLLIKVLFYLCNRVVKFGKLIDRTSGIFFFFWFFLIDT